MGVELRGFKELEDLLKQLPKRFAGKAVQQALKKAAKPIEKAARSNFLRQFPGADDATSRSITNSVDRKWAREQGPSVQAVAVHARSGKRQKNAAPHIHLLEWGTGPRFTKKGAARGRIIAKPFMRPAFDQNAMNSLRILRNELAKAIEVQAKRAASGRRF